jgi:cadmium resistance protein CadD (predicted permease)
MSTDAASVAGAAVVAFVTTDVDNFLLATAQFAVAPAERLRRIAAGQFAGFMTLVAAALAASVALVDIPTRYIGLLGLVPLTLGFRRFVQWRRGQRDITGPTGGWPLAGGAATAFVITLGSGGDNVAVYIPLFRLAEGWDKGLMVLILALGDVLLLGLALVVGRHRVALKTVERIGASVTPFLYMAIGVAVLVRSGTFSNL